MRFNRVKGKCNHPIELKNLDLMQQGKLILCVKELKGKVGYL
jgi:hypothetical protein